LSVFNKNTEIKDTYIKLTSETNFDAVFGTNITDTSFNDIISLPVSNREGEEIYKNYTKVNAYCRLQSRS
jgi:hypothetical protein